MTLGGLALALLGLVLIEQIYRNSAVSERDWLGTCSWVSAAICLRSFPIRTVRTARRRDATAWSVRGAVLVLAVP